MGKGKTTCLSFYLIVNPPIRTNVTIKFCVWISPSVYQVYVSVRLLSVSLPVCVFKKQNVLVLVCYSIGVYDFFFRSSVRPIVRPSTRLVVGPSV